MSDRNTINHIGIVETLNDKQATVKIDSQSACAACHAKGACTAADQKEKILTVKPGNLQVSVGEEVNVLITKRTGLHAVALGYIYPFLVLMVVLITATILGVGELQSGIAAIASLAPYYLVIFLMKDRISKAFTFKLEKLIKDT